MRRAGGSERVARFLLGGDYCSRLTVSLGMSNPRRNHDVEETVADTENHEAKALRPDQGISVCGLSPELFVKAADLFLSNELKKLECEIDGALRRVRCANTIRQLVESSRVHVRHSFLKSLVRRNMGRLEQEVSQTLDAILAKHFASIAADPDPREAAARFLAVEGRFLSGNFPDQARRFRAHLSRLTAPK